ncbi:MAG: type II secretion system protein GspD, partial [Planctomycetota bacterium]
PIYEKLINRLDVRRAQVLLESTIVAIDTTDGFSLGVEISRSDKANSGEDTVLNFSSFGLSTIDDDARLSIKPGVGFNGTLISAEIADVVIRALKSDSRARVVSRPSLLINDNATGTLSSESEEPFSSVNASTSVATTSFGGYSSAGTKIKMTPQISQGEHLKLEYEITLSSFGEEVSDNLPPSRQTNTLASEATIPNGYTIIVGGLSRSDFSENIDRVPLLGELPGLEYLFSNRAKTQREATLFVFIRATILRDDEFTSLKMLSAQAAREAELKDAYPTSEAVEIP